jgi:hypothetical protein
MGDRPAAQALRCFEVRLSVDILRDYLKQLPDFEDIKVESRARTFALEKSDLDAALQFFLDWPRIDLAAKLIVTHPHRWNGDDWHILPKVAALLEHGYPLAATILYRARSGAYGHGAKYFGKLAPLAEQVDHARPGTVIDHATYLARLKKAHPANPASDRAWVRFKSYFCIGVLIRAVSSSVSALNSLVLARCDRGPWFCMNGAR